PGRSTHGVRSRVAFSRDRRPDATHDPPAGRISTVFQPQFASLGGSWGAGKMAENFLQKNLCRILFAVYPDLMEHGPAHEHPETLPGGLPKWFDPQQDAMLTPGRLRVLVHPIRVRLLHLLGTDGPATATQLGRKLGQSSGVTSYH